MPSLLQASSTSAYVSSRYSFLQLQCAMMLAVLREENIISPVIGSHSKFLLSSEFFLRMLRGLGSYPRRKWSMMCCYRSMMTVEVAVVGGGPSGLMLSLLLDQYRIPHALIERRKEPTTHPQAHFINMRTMELLQVHFPQTHRRIVEVSADSSTWR